MNGILFHSSFCPSSSAAPLSVDSRKRQRTRWSGPPFPNTNAWSLDILQPSRVAEGEGNSGRTTVLRELWEAIDRRPVPETRTESKKWLVEPRTERFACDGGGSQPLPSVSAMRSPSGQDKR